MCFLYYRPCLVPKSWQTPIGCLLPKERTAAHHSWHFVQRKEVIWIYDLIKEDIKYHWCADFVRMGGICTLPQKEDAVWQDDPSPVCGHFPDKDTPSSLQNILIQPNLAYSYLGFRELFNVLLSHIRRKTNRPMRNIETFSSKLMYLYLSLVERKVA